MRRTGNGRYCLGQDGEIGVHSIRVNVLVFFSVRASAISENFSLPQALKPIKLTQATIHYQAFRLSRDTGDVSLKDAIDETTSSWTVD